jgi:ABC-2 type transport system ATP-binding protein
MIEAHQLTKRYGDKLAVDQLSFSVRPGVVTGFLGPNGSGKSTTMRMIMGLDAPGSGTVTVNGRLTVDVSFPSVERPEGASSRASSALWPLGARVRARTGMK